MPKKIRGNQETLYRSSANTWKKMEKRTSQQHVNCLFGRKGAEKNRGQTLQRQPSTETFRALQRLNHMCQILTLVIEMPMDQTRNIYLWMFMCPCRISLAVTNPKHLSHPRFRNGEVQVVLRVHSSQQRAAHRDVNLSWS